MVWGILEKHLTICNFASLEWIPERPFKSYGPIFNVLFYIFLSYPSAPSPAPWSIISGAIPSWSA
jgi:hypothetical protein